MLQELGLCVCLSSPPCRINPPHQRFADRGNVPEADGNITCESWTNSKKTAVKDITHTAAVPHSEIAREDSDFSGMEQTECKTVCHHANRVNSGEG